MPRVRALTDAQARELRALYALGRENRPGRLAQKFGISTTALMVYVRREHKSARRRHTTAELMRELPDV